MQGIYLLLNCLSAFKKNSAPLSLLVGLSLTVSEIQNDATTLGQCWHLGSFIWKWKQEEQEYGAHTYHILNI